MAGLDTSALQRTFDAIDALATLDSAEDIMAEAARAFGAFGFSAFVLSRLPRRAADLEPYILLNAWPEDWAARYFEAGHYDYDPVRRLCMASDATFSWDDIPATYFDDERARAVPSEARDFKLNGGLCVPLHTAFGQGGMSLAGEHIEDTPAVRLMARMLSFYVCAAVERVSADAPAMQLTARERDVLSWVAMGKTAREVGALLAISDFTVGDHLKNVRAKLGTRNNAHSVAVALRTGQIKL